MTGGPGVGKTALIDTVLRCSRSTPPTAASKRDAANPLHCDLLVVDRTSMVDVKLMRAPLAAVPDTTALPIVGDIDQLPSVGPAQVHADMIASSVVTVVRLTEVFRQTARSGS